jgi:hypothetical protein
MSYLNPNDLSPQKLAEILDEVSGYNVDLEVDPTQPHLGTNYLHKVLSQCRNLMNRTMHYMQVVKIYERQLRISLKTAETDFDFKISEKLADDPIVRKQPSIDDRKALAMTMLKEEHQSIGEIKATLLDVEETSKLIKSKYDHLRGTASDIKMQRNLVKDDVMIRMGGEEGFSKPVVNQDRTVPNGMRAPVISDNLDPRDLLDPSKRPESMPEPVDAIHAKMIADFFNSSPAESIKPVKVDMDPDDSIKSISYDDLLS